MIHEIESLKEAIQIDGRREVLFVVFSTAGRPQDEVGILSALAQYVPCDPEFHGNNWDAGLDSIAGGISNLPMRNVAIYWHGSQEFRDNNKAEYDKVKECFQGLAEDISDPNIMSDFAKDLVFYFGE